MAAGNIPPAHLVAKASASAGSAWTRRFGRSRLGRSLLGHDRGRAGDIRHPGKHQNGVGERDRGRAASYPPLRLGLVARTALNIQAAVRVPVVTSAPAAAAAPSPMPTPRAIDRKTRRHLPGGERPSREELPWQAAVASVIVNATRNLLLTRTLLPAAPTGASTALDRLKMSRNPDPRPPLRPMRRCRECAALGLSGRQRHPFKFSSARLGSGAPRAGRPAAPLCVGKATPGKCLFGHLLSH